EGKQTKITPFIKVKSELIESDGLDLLFNIQEFVVNSLEKRRATPEQLQKYDQKRTAEEILTSGWGLTCSDLALVFCALARGKGISTEYVQTVHMESYLERPDRPDGHVFCLCYLGGRSYLVDPARGFI